MKASSAMALGREGGLATQFTWWLSSFGETFSVPLVGSIDVVALDTLIDQWEVDSGMELPFDGSISLDGTSPVVQYPRPGLGVDRTGVAQQIQSSLLQLERSTVVAGRFGCSTWSKVVAVRPIHEGLRVLGVLVDQLLEI